MKHFIILFLVSISAFSQSSNISVVSAERLNVVYRGVLNPIKIAVPGAKSFTAKGEGLVAVDSIGNYKLSAGSGNEVKVEITAVMQDGRIIKEEKIFRIKGLPAPAATLYGQEGYIILSKQRLINAVVEFEMKDFLFDIDLNVYSFTLYLPNKKHIDVEGNKMNEQAIEAIRKLKNKQLVTIDNIRYIKNPAPTYCPRPVAPIVVEIGNDRIKLVNE